MKKEKPLILWGVTSSGDLLKDVIELMVEIQSWNILDIETMISKETPFVMKYYKVWNLFKENFKTIHEEKGPNIPFLGGPIQRNKYDYLIIMPVTGNTMAKIAHGIADSLVSNCVSLALKRKVDVYLFPTDQESTGTETTIPDGTRLELYPREIDLENVEKASKMRGVTIFNSLEDIKQFFEDQK
ncbi:MAG: flavoprotein [Candidatus Hodarchaeota archaeon]